MNRNIVAVIIVLILIIIAGIFIRLKNPEETPKKIITQTKKVNTASPKTPENSINNLLKMRKGPPKTCVYSIGENAKYASGVIYFANGKTRVDFSLENESEFISGHGIILAGPSYFWMDSARQGIEMEVNLNESSATQSANSLPLASLVTNLKQDISYTCSTGRETKIDLKFQQAYCLQKLLSKML